MIADIYQRKKRQIFKGEKIFRSYLKELELTIRDCVVMLLTEDQKMIRLGKKYIDSFQKKYAWEHIYLFSCCQDTRAVFTKKNIHLIMCKDYSELLCISWYLSVFELENQIVLFTEKDIFGAKAEILLRNNKFSLEEYVAIGLFRLDVLEE